MEGRLNSPPRPFSVNDAATPLSRSRPEAAIIDRQVRCGAVLAMTEQGMLRLVWRGTRSYCVYLKGPDPNSFELKLQQTKMVYFGTRKSRGNPVMAFPGRDNFSPQNFRASTSLRP